MSASSHRPAQPSAGGGACGSSGAASATVTVASIASPDDACGISRQAARQVDRPRQGRPPHSHRRRPCPTSPVSGGVEPRARDHVEDHDRRVLAAIANGGPMRRRRRARRHRRTARRPSRRIARVALDSVECADQPGPARRRPAPRARAPRRHRPRRCCRGPHSATMSLAAETTGNSRTTAAATCWPARCRENRATGTQDRRLFGDRPGASGRHSARAWSETHYNIFDMSAMVVRKRQVQRCGDHASVRCSITGSSTARACTRRCGPTTA